MTLKAGDIAILKSGGQPLTVVAVEGEKAECLWMGAEGDLFRETLPAIALEIVEIDRSDDDEDGDDDEDEDDAA